MKFKTKRQALKFRDEQHAKGNRLVKVWKFAGKRKNPFFVGSEYAWLIQIS